jgi:hypothetical protein
MESDEGLASASPESDAWDPAVGGSFIDGGRLEAKELSHLLGR